MNGAGGEGAQTSSPGERGRVVVLLLVGVVVLGLVTPFALLVRAIGSSAAFSDAQQVGTNRLGAATLDLRIGRAEALFAAVDLAPGDRVAGRLDVENAGDLPMILSVRGGHDGGVLGDWLLFDLWAAAPADDGDDACDAEDSSADSEGAGLDREIGDLDISGSGGPLRLAVGEERTICVGAHLPLSAPNAVQNTRTEIELIIDAVHDIEAGP